MKRKNKTLVLCATLFLTLCIIIPSPLSTANAHPSDYNYYALFPITTISIDIGNSIVQLNPINTVSLSSESAIDIYGDNIDAFDYRLQFQGRRLGSSIYYTQSVTNFTTFYNINLPSTSSFSLNIIFDNFIYTNGYSLYPYFVGFEIYDELDYSFNVYNPTTGEFDFFEGSHSVNNGQFLFRDFIQLPLVYGDYYYIKNFEITLYTQDNVNIEFSLCLPYVDNLRDDSLFSSYLSSLEGETVVVNRVDVLGSLFETVNNFLDISILPNITFRTLLLIGISIPLLIAVLKMFLGG